MAEMHYTENEVESMSSMAMNDIFYYLAAKGKAEKRSANSSKNRTQNGHVRRVFR